MPSQRRSWNWQAPEQSAHLEQQPDRSSNWTCATSTAGARALPHWIRRCGRHAEAGRDGDAPDGGARHSGEGAAEKSQPARCAHLHWKCPSYPDIYRKIQVLIWCPVARTLQIWRQKGFECTHARTHARRHAWPRRCTQAPFIWTREIRARCICRLPGIAFTHCGGTLRSSAGA